MKSRAFLATLVACAMLVGVSISADKEKVDLKDVKCPVSGKAINPDAKVAYRGGDVYFCCNNCPKAFEKNTAKFAAKATHQLASTKQIEQEKCPISGRDLNPETALKVQGVEVAFCCNNCRGKVEKAEGDEQLELAFGEKAKGWEKAKEKKDEKKS